MSEIDDIFASKGKAEDLVQHVTRSSLSSLQKKKKKRLSTAMTIQGAFQSESSIKRRLPVTIVDTSHVLPIPKRRKKEKSKPEKPESNSKEIAAFKDSGTKTGRRTEEGWVVYKEDELGISNQGGGTELCPFDCNCCF